MTATARKTNGRPSTRSKPVVKPLLDLWGRVNEIATLTLGIVLTACGLFGMVSMVWMYRQAGLLLLAPSAAVAVVVAVILSVRAFRTRSVGTTKTAWGMFATQRRWRWIVAAPLMFLGLLTVAFTPFVIIAETIIVCLFLSVALHEVWTFFRRPRAGAPAPTSSRMHTPGRRSRS